MPLLRSLFFLLCLATAIRAGSTELGAAPVGTISLARALALTLERNPELAGFSWDARSAEARIIQARVRPNPEVSLTAEDVAGSGDFRNGDGAQRTLQLSQLVELGGKRAARVEEAELGRTLADFDYQLKRVQVLRETTEAFIDVLVAQRRLELAEESLKLFESAVPLTERRVEVGKASAVEVTRSNVSVSLSQIEREQAKRELFAAKAKLAAQWGESRSVRFNGVSGDLDHIKAPPEFAALVARLGRNPQLARWTAERERRQAGVRLQQAQAVPDVTVFGGPRVVGNAENITTGVVGLSIPLPFYNRNQGNIAEANAMLSKVDSEERAAEARAFAELSAAYQTLTRASEEVLVLKQNVLPGAAQSVELLTSGYEAGRFSQLEILDARRTLTDARNQHLRALSDYHKALAQVEALTAAPVELRRSLISSQPSKSVSRKPVFRK